ncbi:MAG: hypothetical protein ABJO27_14890 [Pseudoruegeria sp.]
MNDLPRFPSAAWCVANLMSGYHPPAYDDPTRGKYFSVMLKNAETLDRKWASICYMLGDFPHDWKEMSAVD